MTDPSKTAPRLTAAPLTAAAPGSAASPKAQPLGAASADDRIGAEFIAPALSATDLDAADLDAADLERADQPSARQVSGVSRVMRVYLTASVAIAVIAIAYLALLAFGPNKTDDRLPSAGVGDPASRYAATESEPRAAIAIREAGAENSAPDQAIASTGRVSPGIEVRVVEVQDITPAKDSPELRLVKLRAEVDSLAREREMLLARLSAYELGNASFTVPLGPDRFVNQTTDGQMTGLQMPDGSGEPRFGAGEGPLSSVTGYVIEPGAALPTSPPVELGADGSGAAAAVVASGDQAPAGDGPAASAARSLSDALSNNLDLNALGAPRAPLSASSTAPADGLAEGMTGTAATNALATDAGAPVVTAALVAEPIKPELPPIDPVSLTLPGRKIYGVALAEAPSLEMLRLSWDVLLERHSTEFLGALGPRYHTRQSGFQPSYRLIAGPFASASAAQQVCNDLAAQSLSCQLTVYSGSAL